MPRLAEVVRELQAFEDPVIGKRDGRIVSVEQVSRGRVRRAKLCCPEKRES